MSELLTMCIGIGIVVVLLLTVHSAEKYYIYTYICTGCEDLAREVVINILDKPISDLYEVGGYRGFTVEGVAIDVVIKGNYGSIILYDGSEVLATFIDKELQDKLMKKITDYKNESKHKQDLVNRLRLQRLLDSVKGTKHNENP